MARTIAETIKFLTMLKNLQGPTKETEALIKKYEKEVEDGTRENQK